MGKGNCNRIESVEDMENIRVSFIVPVYGVEKYLKICVDSILAFMDSNIEVILVDDGSPDQCPAICDEYADRDARVKVVHQKNAGVSAARNRGIVEAVGEWLYFVDSDDWIDAAEIEALAEEGEQYQADIVFADCIEEYEDGENRRVRLFSETFQTDEKAKIFQIQKAVLCHKYSPHFSKGADNAYPAPWSKLVRRSLVMENNIRFDPYVRGVYDDGIFTLEILESASRLIYTARTAYHYRILQSSIVHAFREDQIQRFTLNCEVIDKFAEAKGKDEDFRQAEYCRRIAYLSSFLTSYFFHPKHKGNRKDGYRELDGVLKRYPYAEALEKAEYRNLEGKHQYTLFCMRERFFFGLYLYTVMKRLIRK